MTTNDIYDLIKIHYSSALQGAIETILIASPDYADLCDESNGKLGRTASGAIKIKQINIGGFVVHSAGDVAKGSVKFVCRHGAKTYLVPGSCGPACNPTTTTKTKEKTMKAFNYLIIGPAASNGDGKPCSPVLSLQKAKKASDWTVISEGTAVAASEDDLRKSILVNDIPAAYRDEDILEYVEVFIRPF